MQSDVRFMNQNLHIDNIVTPRISVGGKELLSQLHLYIFWCIDDVWVLFPNNFSVTLLPRNLLMIFWEMQLFRTFNLFYFLCVSLRRFYNFCKNISCHLNAFSHLSWVFMVFVPSKQNEIFDIVNWRQNISFCMCYVSNKMLNRFE